jgi:hypothetical protein
MKRLLDLLKYEVVDLVMSFSRHKLLLTNGFDLFLN